MTMKRKKFFVILLIITISLLHTHTASANSKKMKELAGNILVGEESRLIMLPLITCFSLYGPIFMLPSQLMPPGPFVVMPDTSSSNLISQALQRPVAPGQILGWYDPKPDKSICYITLTGTPIPVFKLGKYGVSQ